MKELLTLLSEASESQIDPVVSLRLKTLAENPTAAGMKSILDDCARFSLASDFAMAAMHLAWMALIKDEAAQAK